MKLRRHVLNTTSAMLKVGAIKNRRCNLDIYTYYICTLVLILDIKYVHIVLSLLPFNFFLIRTYIFKNIVHHVYFSYPIELNSSGYTAKLFIQFFILLSWYTLMTFDLMARWSSVDFYKCVGFESKIFLWIEKFDGLYETSNLDIVRLGIGKNSINFHLLKIRLLKTS